MRHGLFLILVPVVLGTGIALPYPAWTTDVHIFGDGQVGGLDWEPTLQLEMCEFQFFVEGVPWPPAGCPVEYDWTFSGCGAEPSSSTEHNPLVRFT